MKSIKKLLKKRKYTLKNKFYVEASYLNKTDFKEGVGLSYNINYNTKELTVVTTNEKTRNHVASVTQTRTKKVVPTIDIRKSDVKEFLKNAGELELSVYEDKIILSVVANEKEQLQEELLRDENNNIVELASYRNSKAKSFAVNMANQQAVVGGEQITFADLFNSDIKDIFNPTKLKNKAINMISLFSGCGMLDKGFLDNGNYNIKFAIDMFEKKRLRRYHLDTYRHNIGDHIVEGDVLELTKEDIPEADFVAGGIPCVKFSKLNTKDNFRNKEDEKFPLLEQFLNVVEWSKAKVFLIENVKEFITVKGGAMIKRIKERMKDFNIAYKVINSADLGSAQSRERAFILGIKGIEPKLELPKINPVRFVRDVFKGVENTPQHDIRLELKGKYLEMAKYIPQGGNGKDVPEELRPNRKFDNFIQRLHLDKHSPTLTGIDSDYMLHPTEDRKPSVAECRRIQGMPDDFLFIGSATSIFTQLKNGVDYNVSSFLAKTIFEQVAPVL